jgi:hypothetical protein
MSSILVVRPSLFLPATRAQSHVAVLDRPLFFDTQYRLNYINLGYRFPFIINEQSRTDITLKGASNRRAK